MTPKTDRELLKLLELAEPFVATSLLDKTRQALNTGLSQDHYFRDSDLVAIVNYCRVHKPQFLPEVTNYVLETRSESANRILSSNGMFLDTGAIVGSGELWAVLPDYRFFKSSHPAQAQALCERARTDVATFTLVTSDPRDAEMFWEECRIPSAHERETATRTESTVDAMSYSIVIEPTSPRPQGFALVSGGYQRLDPMRTEGLRAFVNRLSPAPLAAKPPARSRSAERR